MVPIKLDVCIRLYTWVSLEFDGTGGLRRNLVFCYEHPVFEALLVLRLWILLSELTLRGIHCAWHANMIYEFSEVLALHLGLKFGDFAHLPVEKFRLSLQCPLISAPPMVFTRIIGMI